MILLKASFPTLSSQDLPEKQATACACMNRIVHTSDPISLSNSNSKWEDSELNVRRWGPWSEFLALRKWWLNAKIGAVSCVPVLFQPSEPCVFQWVSSPEKLSPPVETHFWLSRSSHLSLWASSVQGVPPGGNLPQSTVQFHLLLAETVLIVTVCLTDARNCPDSFQHTMLQPASCLLPCYVQLATFSEFTGLSAYWLQTPLNPERISF